MSNLGGPSSLDNLDVLLTYLADEIEGAQSREDLEDVFSVVKGLFTPSSLQNTVLGLDHIRAEVDREAIARVSGINTRAVELEVPEVLAEAFQDLAQHMRALQNDDTEAFGNASRALHWLASGDRQPTN